MSYITREDGERFVIPSYRETVTAKNSSALKKEILSLCKAYGEYITLQRISPVRYEVAFSPDSGYLLGESIWYQLKRPDDLVYCEAIPNTKEAILVIVKNGSVYLDGRFPLDTIADELVVFLTQENHFEIYIYGDVPISQAEEPGKFSFNPASVKSFTILEQPLFPQLPLLRIYQLQLAEPALRAHHIGVFPTAKIVTVMVVAVVVWLIWGYLTAPKEVVEQIITRQFSPYQNYVDALASPAPDAELRQILPKVKELFGLPGWYITKIDYSKATLTVTVKSNGANIGVLQVWAKRHGMMVDIDPKAIMLKTMLPVRNRSNFDKIYPIKEVVIDLTDKLALIYPGNVLKLGNFINRGVYMEEVLTINLAGVSLDVIALIANQLEDLPIVLQGVSLANDNGFFNGSITLKLLGS